MRVVGYLRVSTAEQAQHGLGLDVQERTIRAWCKANGHRLVAIHSDAGISGSNGVGSRLGLADATQAIIDGTAGGIVVKDLSRWSRDQMLQEQLLADVWRAGGRLFSTSAAEDALLDPAGADLDPSRKMVRTILGSVHEYEKSMIRLRMAAGRRRKAEQGGYAYGSPGYGWRAAGGALVPDEDEQAVIRTIMEMSAAGASTRAIAAALNAEGIKPRRAELWSNATVAGIIRRERDAAESQPAIGRART